MSTKESTMPEFSGWRAVLWPIHGFELKKFLPLSFIMFCLLFNYTILRDTKDTLVVTSAGAGAITFLKLYCVTPAAILFVVIYAKLTNILRRETIFYAVVAPFLIFFGAFGFLIYPNLDLLHPSVESISALHASYPRLSGFIDLYAYWAYSVFYVLAEIWGSAMIALMFWQFANYVVRMRESKRFYGLFAVIGNVALILSGQVVGFSSGYIQNFFATKEEAWGVSLYLLMGAVVFFGLISMAIYRWMYTNVLVDKRYFDPDEQIQPKKKKEKPSLLESAKLILRSPELGLIAALIMAYGVAINLVEVQWKHQLGLWYAGDKGGYNWFMGQFSTITGIVTILFGLFVGSNILRSVSWFKAAIITPLVITIGGVVFFFFVFSETFIEFILKNLSSVSTVTAATFLGAFIVIASKAIKYILFDATKEMAYIPLDEELKSKGKAAVDVIGGRTGKAGGAFTQSTLLILFATKDVVAIAPQAFIVFAVVCCVWMISVKLLARKVDEAVKRRNNEVSSATTKGFTDTVTVS